VLLQISAQPDGEFDLVSKRHREISIFRVGDMFEILRAMGGIVCDDHRAQLRPAFDKPEHVDVERLGAIGQEQVDPVEQVQRKRIECVAFAYLDEVSELAGP
jgi:hypothetical protein